MKTPHTPLLILPSAFCLLPSAFCFLLFAFCFLPLSAQENPFLKMAGKPYHEYYQELDETAYSDAECKDSLQYKQKVLQMREVAKITKEKKWALEADYLEILLLYSSLYYNGKLTQSQKDSLSEILIQNTQFIINKAKKIDAFDIEFRALYYLWQVACINIKDYEMGFRFSAELDKEMSAVSSDKFPPKSYYYSEMGKQYYYFQEYEKAKDYFEKSLEPPNEHKSSSWNSLGLIYRNFYNDLEKSDSYFLKILDNKPEQPKLLMPGVKEDVTYQEIYNLWVAIAKGNLGTNCYLRGDYDAAIPLLQYGMEKVIENNEYNYAYAIGKAYILSEIFLSKHDFAQVKLYADKMRTFLTIIEKDELALGHRIEYYELMSNYYHMMGNDTKAFLYADSAAKAHSEYENVFNESKLYRADRQIQQEKLDAEILRSKIYYRDLIMISSFGLLLLLLLALLFRLYRQKRAAYRVLVIKAQEWAQVTPTQSMQIYKIDKEESGSLELQKEIINEKPTEFDQQLFDRLNLLLTEQKIYQNASLTLNQIAQNMNVNRTYLSQAVNRCAGNNFSTYINEFRIKEAVRLMSNPKWKNISIEGIALDSGFNDRSTFYRVFKKTTGFSPTDFRNNITV